MRQVVNSAKGGPLLGHSSCIMRSEEQHVKDYSEEEDMDEDDDVPEDQLHATTQQQRRRHGHPPKSK